jgi:hypothetical protein
MMMTITFAEAFQRTEAGRAEIRAHGVPLARPARNLLMVIDGTCGATDWVKRVNGSTERDLAQLLDAGLIAPVVAAPPARTIANVASPAAAPASPGAPAAAAAAAPRGPSLEEALSRWGYEALYNLLTHEAKERFGLIKGYRLILEIERCSGPDEIRGMAMKFVEQLRSAHGDETALRFARHIVTNVPATPPKA